VVLLGIAMIALPGPAVVVIPAGLALLATEFLWARRALHRCKVMAAKARQNPCWLWLPRRKSNHANY
jgi:tellurite resistance protein TerC